MDLLDDAEITRRLKSLDGWTYAGGELVREFKLKNFAGAMAFVNRVADLAEKADHHPDIDIRWNKVTLRLATHSKGGVTELDFKLAGKIAAL
ncbi:4a-hydroxytetrahydrobiopterin dehydratase [soil metagenome]